MSDVDKTKTEVVGSVPEGKDHRELKSNGQQLGYLVLSEEERRKGYKRPFRTEYVHKVCGAVTKMGLAIAETYATVPDFYSGTFCIQCEKHFPLKEFVWKGTELQVGS